MHPEAYEWVTRHATTEAVSVLDIGGRNVNGSVKDLFPRADPYVALDILPGEGVDIVADASNWQPDRGYDVVVCCETFEHTPVWAGICVTAYKALNPGGRFILTTAAPGRPPHSAIDGGVLRGSEYYGNIIPAALRRTLDESGFTDVIVDERPSPADVRAVAVRP